MTGSAGTTGSAGVTGSAGMTGHAGATGTAGVTGMGGMTGTGGSTGRVPVKHRAAAPACAKTRPVGLCGAATMPGATLQCKVDADCQGGENGRCLPMARILGCSCSYDACFADADCPAMSGPCECRVSSDVMAGSSTANVCKLGNCRVDPDCGAGGFCSPSLGSCGNYSGVVGYYCHSSKDKCTDDADCAAQGTGDCRYEPTVGAWTCQNSQCAG